MAVSSRYGSSGRQRIYTNDDGDDDNEDDE